MQASDVRRSIRSSIRRSVYGGIHRTIRHRAAALALLALAPSALTACASLNNKERGAIVGAAAGGAVGGAVGSKNGGTARGAIIGAAVGGAAGAIIGHQMDQRAKEIQQTVAGAKVERVGEGLLVTFESGLLFDFDSDALRAAARENLRNLAQSLQKSPDTNVMIVGHTDAQGTDSYNQGLSERRAAAAAAFLGEQGVARPRLIVRGRGESEPVASNDSEGGRAQNRRVEVALYANSALRDQALRQSALR
jgi:outer membrane protein OmpA-like peptidoglycan-associated protein